MARKKADAYIGIMVRSHKQGRWVLQNYRKYVPRHTQLFSFLPSSINWTKQTVLGLYYTGRGYLIKRFPFPSVVYNRYYGAQEALIKRIEKKIGENKCFNHVTHFDKQKVYDLLSQTGLVQYLPQTLPYEDQGLKRLLESYGTVYLKPCMGHKGRGVYRAELVNTNEVYFSQHHTAPLKICRDKSLVQDEIHSLLGATPYIVQQGISPMQVNGKNFDIRVLVQKTSKGLWNATDIISRTAYVGYFNTSMCETTGPSKDTLRELFNAEMTQSVLNCLCTMSLQTARHLEDFGKYHLGELSVDWVIDEKVKLWIVEVNGDPQRTIYKGLPSCPQVYGNPMKYARFLLEK